MEKVLTIDGRRVKFKSTGAFLLRYKAQFKRDAIQDIYKLQDALGSDNKVSDIDTLELDVLLNLAWTLAKTADPSIPPPLEWLDAFGEFPLMDIMPELIEMLLSSMTSTAPAKKK